MSWDNIKQMFVIFSTQKVGILFIKSLFERLCVGIRNHQIFCSYGMKKFLQTILHLWSHCTQQGTNIKILYENCPESNFAHSLFWHQVTLLATQFVRKIFGYVVRFYRGNFNFFVLYKFKYVRRDESTLEIWGIRKINWVNP